MPLSDNFFMNGKILDSTKFYKFGFHRKIVTQKNLPLQAFATSTLRNSIGRRALIFGMLSTDFQKIRIQSMLIC